MIQTYRLEDLHEGLSHQFEVQITEYMLSDFRKLSGDESPIHVDRGVARASGFKDRVVYGLLTASSYSKLIGNYLPGQRALLQSIEITFHNPVFVGDTLTVRGEVESVRQGLRLSTVKAKIHNQDGTLVSKAKIMVGIRE